MASLNNIEKILAAKLQKAVLQLPTILANHAVNVTKDNFAKQGFQNQSLEAWKPRAINAVRNKGRALLVDTGRLKRSIRVLSVSGLKATYGSAGVPYAAAHNNGFKGTVNVKSHKRNIIGTIKVSTGKSDQPFKKKQTITGVGTVKAYQRNMNLPRRRFLGYSVFLHRQLNRMAAVHIAKALKS